MRPERWTSTSWTTTAALNRDRRSCLIPAFREGDLFSCRWRKSRPTGVTPCRKRQQANSCLNSLRLSAVSGAQTPRDPADGLNRTASFLLRLPACRGHFGQGILPAANRRRVLFPRMRHPVRWSCRAGAAGGKSSSRNIAALNGLPFCTRLYSFAAFPKAPWQESAVRL